jgi:prolyl oligopeptidase
MENAMKPCWSDKQGRQLFAITLLFAFVAMGLLAAGVSGDAPTAAKSPRLEYPAARKSDHVDEYHGVKVPDPYRWLEDPRSEESRKWIEAENKLTFGYLEKVPNREAVRKRLTELWNYERFGNPEKHGEKYFYLHNNGLQEQSVLYAIDSLSAEPRTLLDANKLSKDGTSSMAGFEFSEDGRRLAYGVSHGGSDWQEWKVRDVATAKDSEDHLKWVKFSGASWTRDGRGFFYSRYDEPNEKTKLEDQNYFQKLYFHRVGTPQSEDKLIYERKDEKRWGFDGDVTEDGKYLVVTVWVGTERNNGVLFQSLSPSAAPVANLLTEFDARYEFIGNEGPVFWFFTDLNAPRGRVIAIDTTKPERAAWKEIIPEAKDALRSVHLVGDRFIASYLKDATSLVRVFALDGKHVRDVDLPGIGTASGFGGRRSDKETFYTFSSYTTPGTVYRYDIASGKSSVWRRPKVGFDPDDYESRQVFYKSKDGTRVPMLITHKRGLRLTGDNPTLLYGYGGFNVSITPQFSVTSLVWMEMGGVYAVPNLRGGGEYGKTWHDAGKKQNKQNVFDDFIAAAQWLIDNKYTSRAKLAIHGRSNGGLLVGASMTQRPDLFGAAVPGVGVMDMLRFHKFTIGWAWVSDYGSSDEADDFKTLRAYSPLHNIKPGTKYPPTLITTADHDDRVVPAHSFKFAATLQAAQAGDVPVLIRIETSAGHGAGTATSKRIAEATDILAFLSEVLGESKRKK